MVGDDFRCPIWGTQAKKQGEFDYGDKVTVNSSRAGGVFTVTKSSISMLSQISPRDRAKITTWLVDQRRLGNDNPVIHSNFLRELHKIRELSVAERRDRFLLCLNLESSQLGRHFRISGEVEEKLKNFRNKLMAWTECTEQSELSYLIEICADEGLIKQRGGAQKQIYLTPKAYQQIEEQKGINRASSQAFVAMWFDQSMDLAYSNGFEKAIRSAGYQAMRIDQVEHIGKIDDRIIAEIRRSRFLVSDFTSKADEPRGGVYFEAGFAYGLNIPVIWTCRADMIGSIHFDTRQFNHIIWDNPDDLFDKLKNRIEAVIGDGPYKESQPDFPSGQ